jgi:CheY-like chemotaxis protein
MRKDERVNILMVDDQPAMLLSYEVMLAELGENLIKAASAKEALEILLKTDVAVVLMVFAVARRVERRSRSGSTRISVVRCATGQQRPANPGWSPKLGSSGCDFLRNSVF